MSFVKCSKAGQCLERNEILFTKAACIADIQAGLGARLRKSAGKGHSEMSAFGAEVSTCFPESGGPAGRTSVVEPTKWGRRGAGRKEAAL